MDDTTVADIDETTSAETDLLDDELLVEEISIDGMCGVY
jgi:mycofactocin precursor